MRNAIFSSVSPQLYNFGDNEIQMPNLDISMQVDSLVTNVQRNSRFSMDSKIFKDHDNQPRSGGFSVSCQTLFNYPQGANFQPFSTSCDNIISPQSLIISQKPPYPQFEWDIQSLQNAIDEVNNFLPQEAHVHNKRTSNVYKKNQNKKMKTSSEDQNWLHDHYQIEDPSNKKLEQRVPVRRSQKLSDKITALQKLVSPYGKTDTASVLQEASFYIKLLQDQIKNLFQMLSSSYNSISSLHSQEIGEEESDLRSRGFCLVPISVTQKLTKYQDLLIDSHSISRNTTMP